MNIKITFKSVQKIKQDGLESQGMFIFCDKADFLPDGLLEVFSGDDVNHFLIWSVLKIEIV